MARITVLALAVLALAACARAVRVPPSVETIAALTGEQPIVAVHYHDLDPGPMRVGNVIRAFAVRLAAPTGLIKDRFVRALEPKLGVQIRTVPEPRFAYLVRGSVPDIAALKRTFGSGLVFDFYSPLNSLPATGGRLHGSLEIQVRLLRLDDLAVLWADSCSFDAGQVSPAPLLTRVESVERLYAPTVLDRAAGCADMLAERLTASAAR